MKWNRVLVAAVVGVVVSMTSAHAETSGIRGEYVKSIAEVEQKAVSLAEATPDKKFAWRPTKGVRSVSEVYMHMANANFILPSFAGVKAPEGMSPEMETTVTDKAKVVETLKSSFAHLKQAIEGTSDADLDNTVKTFLGEMSVRNLYLVAVNHGHEHLGQSIAYARMNNITPPWTAASEAAEKEKKKDEKK